MNKKSIPSKVEVSVVMPCLNEAETLATCIQKARKGLIDADVSDYEIVIADNGSSDGSQEIARSEGAVVFDAPYRGYGAALQTGIENATGKFVIMGDSDDSYDWSQLSPFINKLREGYQLVMGTRIRGDIHPGAMPFLHRYLGTPVLTFLGNLFFGSRLSDFNCGMRGFDKQAIQKLDLLSPGMEFASEMVIRSQLAGLSVAEIPIAYYPDGRSRAPYLQTWRDGWRHLNFMLIFSPRWLFLYPGIFMVLLGLIGGLALLPGPLTIGRVTFDVHSLLFFATLLISGLQLLILALFTRIYASVSGFLPHNERWEKIASSLSGIRLLVAGLALSLIGASFYIWGFLQWGGTGFGGVDYQSTLRVIIPGTVLVIIGLQAFFSSFLYPMLIIGRQMKSKP